MKTADAHNKDFIGFYHFNKYETRTIERTIKMIKKPKKVNWKKKAWEAFSEHIRSRGHCEFHGRCEFLTIPPPCKCAGVLQACHKISRSKTAIKFDERNVFCGCAGSNTWAHFNEAEWSGLWKQLWMEDVEYLESRKDKVVKMNQWTFKLIHDEYSSK
jgi:hypothetical protein